MIKFNTLFLSIVTIGIVLSDQSISMIRFEEQEPPAKNIKKTPVRLGPKPTQMVIKTTKIPEYLDYSKKELKYDISRDMYYYGSSLDEATEKNSLST